MLDNLSNDELRQIYNLELHNKRIKDIIDKEEDDSSIFILREHAFFTYWKRKMNLGHALSDEDINSILSWLKFPAAKSILGEASIYNLLSKSQCSHLLTQLVESEWAYKAILSRLLVLDITSKCMNSKRQLHTSMNTILDQLISLKMAWAILEILPYLNIDELAKLRQDMNNKLLLTKHNRHLIRERIDNIYKEMQHKDDVIE